MRRSVMLRNALTVAIVSLSCAAVAVEPPPDSVDRDYSAELPRIKPVAPGDALATFKVAPGFRLELVAHEPLVVDPIAMSFDEDGRLFVVEMRDYSEQAEDKLGRVRLLTDTDGDGRFDKSTVYAGGLSWPTAVCCYGGGIFVAAAPDLWYCKDIDGDGRADQQEKIFTGFGRGNVQGLVNTLLWGPDNRIHGATSSAGAALTRVDSEADKNAKPLDLRGRDFSFDPRSYDLRAESGGGQHGMSFNDWGEKFVSSNSDHLQMIICEDRYLARNPFYAAPSPRISIAADGPQADVFRSSPVEPWRVVRTRLRVSGVVPGIVEGGGKPAGYFTGATGVTIYRGSAMPELYGCAIVGDVGSNLVHRKTLELNGLTYNGRRIDEKSELIASTDNWFRPVQFANGPDGALYIADMYREVIEHPASLPPVIKKHLDLTSGRDRGRIYRLVVEGFQQPDVPKMSKRKTSDVVPFLFHTNAWHRETALRLVYERQDRTTPVPRSHAEGLDLDGTQRARNYVIALDALAGLHLLTVADIHAALHDRAARVRRHAVRLAEPFLVEAQVAEWLRQMTDDEDRGVRFQLALTLGDARDERRMDAYAKLLRSSDDEPWMRPAIMSGVREGASDLLSRLARSTTIRKMPAGKELINQLATQIGKQQRPDDTAAVLRLVGQLAEGEDDDRSTAQQIVERLAPQGELAAQLAAATGGKSDAWRIELAAASRAAALNDELADEVRVAAIYKLSLGKFTDQREAFATLLQPTVSPVLQQAAAAELARFDEEAIGQLLLAGWANLSPQTRGRAMETLLARDAWVKQLFAAVERGDVSASEIPTARLQILAARVDPQVARPARKLLDDRHGRRAEVLAKYQASLAASGDAERGRAVFTKHCAACHKLGDLGHEIGPNLASAATRGAETIVVNVLDPNREVNPQYVNYVAVAKDGRSYSGMLAAETSTSVTLVRGEKASDMLLRVDIDEIKSTGTSLMPEGFEREIDPTAMADLLSFLLRSQ